MMTNYETLLLTKEGGITTITFNRPEKRNAMSPQLHREMFQLLTELRYDKETRVIVLTGAGESFCAGQDLKQYALEMESQPEWVRDEVREKVRRWRNEMLRTLPQPVIARDHGLVPRRSAHVVAGCDIAIAAEDALFGLPEVNFGHFPAGDTTAVLTEHLQPKHGLYYALTGKMMTAKEAERIGLISKVVPRADLDKEVAEVAGCLAEKSPDGSEGGQRSVVLQFVFHTGCCLRGLAFDFPADDTGTWRTTGPGAVRAKETPAGLGCHETVGATGRSPHGENIIVLPVNESFPKIRSDLQ